MLTLGGHNGRVKGGYNGNGGYNGPKAGDTMVRGDTMVGGDTMVHNTRVVSHWLTQILTDNSCRQLYRPHRLRTTATDAVTAPGFRKWKFVATNIIYFFNGTHKNHRLDFT